VITVDAGNFSGWAQRFWRFRHPRSQLGPTSGAMGYSVPAGVAASILAPEREVVSFVGDGGFLMSGQELATAAQHGARPLVLIVNNSMYGTIRMHQERSYPGRTIGTDLKNPDFAVLAKVYGAHGERVTRTDQFPDALGRARASGTAAVIELVVDPDQITTRTTLAQLHGTETGDSGPNSRQPGT
jgi:acetolactate synthase-1/2/3 large subunit